MDDNNQKLNGWGQNNGIPEAWGKQNNLPEGWGKQSSDNAQNNDTSSIYDTVKSSAEKLSETATKVGGAAKNAANRAVEFAKSDEVKEKLNAAKNKAKSLADGAGSAFAGLKEKTGEAINERRAAKEKSAEISDNPVADTSKENKDVAAETYKSEEVFDTENNTSEHISETFDSADFDVLNENAIHNVNDEESYDEVNENEVDDTKTGYVSKNIEQPVTPTSVNPSPTPYTQPVTSQNQFNYENQKKSSIVYVLIGVISVLLVGMGILGGMLLVKNKGSTPNSNNVITKNVTEASTTEESAEKATIDESKIEITTKENVEITSVLPKPTATAYIEEVSFYPMGDGSSFILHVDGDYSYYYFEGYYTGGGEYDYMCAYGETSDQTVELTAGSVMSEVRAVIVPYNSDEVAGDKIYASIKPQYSSSSSISSDDPYYNIKQEIMHSVDNEYYSGKNSHIENAPSDMIFYALDNRSNIEIENPTVFSGPDVNYSLIDVYTNNFYIVGENSNWYYVMWADGMGAFSHACYGYIEKSSINQKKEYTFEEIKSKAGYDFHFYEYSGPYTIVNTERDPLNLRAAPSTNADVITKIPKGTYVTAHAGNGEWSLISYYNEEEDILYYGFASSQYLY